MADICACDFWWENVTGPSYFVSKIAQSLVDGVSVILCVPEDLPWRHAMRNSVRSLIAQRFGRTDAFVEEVDVNDVCPDEDPGAYIIRTWGDRDTSSNYRKGSSKSIQSYIVDNHVLRNRILWIKGISFESIGRWLHFVDCYQSGGLIDGLIVIEISSCIDMNNNIINVSPYTKYVSPNDVQMLCRYMLYRNYAYSEDWQDYIAILVSRLCRCDGEVAETVLRDMNFRDSDYHRQLKSLAQNTDLTMRGSSETSDSILRLAREDRMDEVDKRIWAAQVQVLFPIIELERVNIIRKQHDRISQVLNMYQIEQFKEILTDPMDVELGTLDFMVHTYHVINDSKLIHRITFLHDCRNKIAHGDYCSPSQIDELFSGPYVKG